MNILMYHVFYIYFLPPFGRNMYERHILPDVLLFPLYLPVVSNEVEPDSVN